MRNRLSGLLVAVAIGLAATATLLAHHSVPGQFDMSKPVTLKGVISKIDWINPHIYVHLDVKDGRRHDQHMGAGDSADRDDAARGSDQGDSSGQARRRGDDQRGSGS